MLVEYGVGLKKTDGKRLFVYLHVSAPLCFHKGSGIRMKFCQIVFLKTESHNVGNTV